MQNVNARQGGTLIAVCTKVALTEGAPSDAAAAIEGWHAEGSELFCISSRQQWLGGSDYAILLALWSAGRQGKLGKKEQDGSAGQRGPRGGGPLPKSAG